MPRSARAPSRLGAGDGTGDRAEGLTEPLLDADDVLTPGARFSARRDAGGAPTAPERTPPNTTARRAGLGIPPSPTPEEWSALRRELRVRQGELYVTSPAGARPTTSSGVPLLRGASLFRSVSRRDASADMAPRTGDAAFPERERTRVTGRRASMDGDDDTGDDTSRHRISLAAEYVRDALDGSTHLTFRVASRAAARIARWQRTRAYAFCLNACLLLNLVLVFYEPTTRYSRFSVNARTRTLVAELGFTFVFVAAASLDLARLGWERYRAKRWRFVFAACALFLFLDALVALMAVRSFAKKGDELNLNLGGFGSGLSGLSGLSGDGRFTSSAVGNETRDASSARRALRATRRAWLLARPTRCLRPLPVIAHFRPTRRLVASAAKTLSRLRSTVRLIGVLILAWATLGVQLYQGAYDVEDVDDRGNFDNAFDGAVAMTVLLTTENFPDVMRPALGFVATRANGVPKPVSACFFVSFIVLGVWLGMSLWTSVIFETYKQQHRRKVRGARAREQKALIAAYSVLRDAPADERLSAETWIAVAMKARAGLTAAHARALFATLDRNGDGMIDVEAFLNTCDALRARVARAPALVGEEDATSLTSLESVDVERNVHRDDEGFETFETIETLVSVRTSTRTSVRFRHAVGSFARSSRFALASRALAYFQTAVICARRRDAGAAADALVDSLDGACVFLLALEMTVKTAAACLRVDGVPKRTRDGRRFFCASSDGARGFVAAHGFDFVLALVSVASFLNPRADSKTFRRRTAPFRVLRLATTDPALRRIVSTFARCARVIGTLLAVLACVVYAYACVGLEIFGSEVTLRRGYCVTGDETSGNETSGDVGFADFADIAENATSAAAPCLDREENFETPWNAFLALFQVATSNNWHNILYPNAAAMRVGGAGEIGRVFAVFYFVSFYFVTVLLLVNILTSLVLEMFGVAQTFETFETFERTTASDEGDGEREGDVSGRDVSGLEAGGGDGDVSGDARDGVRRDEPPRGDDAVCSSSPFATREVVMVDGVAFEVTRARDFDRDVLLAASGNGGAAAERAALVKQLERAERQIARRRHERVAGIVRATRTERLSGSPSLGARSDAEPGGSSPSGSSFRFRFRATEPDLARELDALADDDVARAVEILRAELEH